MNGTHLGDAFLKLRKRSLDKPLLVLVDTPNREDLLNTVHAQLNWDRKICEILSNLTLNLCTSLSVSSQVDITRSNDPLLAVQRPQDLSCKLGPSVRHTKGSTPGTILGLDDLISTKLDAVCKSFDGFLLYAAYGAILGYENRVGGLGEEGDDGDAAVASNDRDDDAGSNRGVFDDFSNKS